MNEHDNFQLPPQPPQIITEEKTSAGTDGYSISDILSRIDKIISDTEHIYKALDMISEITPSGGFDHGAANKADSIASVVKSREKTNQNLIRLLERMYADLAPQREPENVARLKAVVEVLKGLDIDQDVVGDMLASVFPQIFREPPAAENGSRYHNGAFFWNGSRPQPRPNNAGSKIPRQSELN